MCLYKGFTRRFYLFYVSISDAYIKLSKYRKEKSAQNIALLELNKTPHTDINCILIPPIQENGYWNSHHIPVNIDMPSSYEWGGKKTGGTWGGGGVPD